MLRFANPLALYLLWLVPLLGAFLWLAFRAKKRALQRFGNLELLQKLIAGTSRARQVWKGIAFIFAVVLVILALARPQIGTRYEEVKREGIDVLVAIDVSNSMLAQDIPPSRLEKAKHEVESLIELLRGDRIGLIAFAGVPFVQCPLTLDYGFFRMMLDGVSVNSIARGGTMIGDAIRKTLDEVFDDQEKQHKDIILITDGEDHDSFPEEAAKQAGQRGVRLIAIGLGDENEGKRIPVSGEDGRRVFLKYEGQEIWSRLDADTLRKMVNATPGGRYLNVATGTIDLGDVYLRLVAGAEKRELESKTIKRYEEKFQVFLGLCVALLCVEMVIRDRRRTGQTGS